MDIDEPAAPLPPSPSAAARLATALVEGDADGVAGNLAAANAIVTQYRTAANVDAPIAPLASASPFANAGTIDALLAKLQMARPAAPSAEEAAAQAALAAATARHSTRAEAPSAAEWEAHGTTMLLLIQKTLELCSRRADERNVLRAPTPVLAVEDVARCLVQQYGGMPSCLFDKSCVGARHFGDGEVMLRYYSPAEWRHWCVTGTLTAAMQTRQPCYLCQLTTGNVMMRQAPALKAEDVVPPFAHYVDAPGGYKRSALHTFSDAASHGVTTLLRHYDATEYRATRTEVYMPGKTQAEPLVVSCLAERADVAFGAPDDPGAFLQSRARQAPPSCEALLAAELVPSGTLVGAEFSAVDTINAHIASFCASPDRAADGEPCAVVPLHTAFGCVRPATLELIERGATNAEAVRAALSFCSLAEARVRLFHLMNDGGVVSCGPLLRMRCLPSQFAGAVALPPAAAGLAETEATVLRFSLLYLLLLRLDVLATLPKTPRVAAYVAALQPLYGYMHSAATRTELSDAALFAEDKRGERLIPYAELYPSPAPVYFDAGAIRAWGAAQTDYRKLDQPTAGRDYFYYVCTTLPAPAIRDPVIPQALFAAAWRSAASLCALELLPALAWTQQHAELVPPCTEALPLSLPVGAPGITRSLREAFADPATPWLLVWWTIALRLAVLYAALEVLPLDSACDPTWDDLAECVRDAGARAPDVFSFERDLAPELAAVQWPAATSYAPAAARRYVKALVYAHMPLCLDLLQCNCVTDAECDPILTEHYQALVVHDGPYAVPLHMSPVVLARLVDGAVSKMPLVAVLRDALPTLTMRGTELQRALAVIIADSADGLVVLAQAAQACLGGYLPGATRLEKPQVLLDLYARLADPESTARRATLAAMLESGTLTLCVQRYVIAAMERRPELALALSCRYSGVYEWCQRVIAAIDGAAPGSLHVAARPSPASFGATLLAAAGAALDREFGDRGAALVPPRATVDAISAYAAALPRAGPIQIEWLEAIGLRQRSLEKIETLLALAAGSASSQLASAAQACLWEICLVYPLDVILFHCFVYMRQQHDTRSVVRLDRDTAQRQLYALKMRPSKAYLSSALCCNRICNFTAQSGDNYMGLNNVALRVDGATLHCDVHRHRAPDAARSTARGRPHVALCDSYRQPCGATLTAMLPVGLALEHHRPPPGSAPGYMVCPRCGTSTAPSPALIGPCGMSCGTCDLAERAAAREVAVPDTRLRCFVCGAVGDAAKRMARQLGVMACVTRRRIVDDRSIEGAAQIRDAVLCSLCYKPWILPALDAGLTAMQIHDALTRNAHYDVGADELLDPPHDVRFRQEAAAFVDGTRLAPPMYEPAALAFSQSVRAPDSDGRYRSERGPRPHRPPGYKNN